MKVIDIINRALRLLGVSATNESPDAPEARDSLSCLNMIIDQWSNERLMTYLIRNDLWPIIGSQDKYSIGLPQTVTTKILHDSFSGRFKWTPTTGLYETEQSIQMFNNGVLVTNPVSIGSYTEVVYTTDGSLPAIASLEVAPQTSPITNGTLYTGSIPLSQFKNSAFLNADGTYTVNFTVTIWGGGITNYTTYNILMTFPDFLSIRPLRVEPGTFCRDTLPGYNNDYKLEIIPNDRYQEIYQKQLQTTYPQYLWYHPDLPYGTITIWPVPIRNMQLGLATWQQLLTFNGLSGDINLPPGYEMALSYALAYHMALEYDSTKLNDGQLFKLMNEAKSNIKRVNTEKAYLSTDQFLFPNPPRSFNIYGGRP